MWDSAVRRENYKRELKDQYGGFVEFDDKIDPDKPSYRNPISLDIKTFWNTTWIERNKSKTVENALYGIADMLKSYTNEHGGVWICAARGGAERQGYEQKAPNLQALREHKMWELTGQRDEPPNDHAQSEHDRTSLKRCEALAAQRWRRVVVVLSLVPPVDQHRATGCGVLCRRSPRVPTPLGDLFDTLGSETSDVHHTTPRWFNAELP